MVIILEGDFHFIIFDEPVLLPEVVFVPGGEVHKVPVEAFEFEE